MVTDTVYLVAGHFALLLTSPITICSKLHNSAVASRVGVNEKRLHKQSDCRIQQLWSSTRQRMLMDCIDTLVQVWSRHDFREYWW